MSAVAVTAPAVNSAVTVSAVSVKQVAFGTYLVECI